MHAVTDVGLCVSLIMVFKQINDEDNHIDPSQPNVFLHFKIDMIVIAKNKSAEVVLGKKNFSSSLSPM